MKQIVWTAAMLAGIGIITGCQSFSDRVRCAVTPNMEYCNGVIVEEMLLDDTPYNREHKMPGKMEELKYITIHNTWNVAPAINERTYLNNRQDNEYISFHYAVDESGAIRILPDDQRGWHAGDGANGPGNSSSIGIEICRSRCYDEQEELYRKAEANAVLLAAWLLDQHNLPMSALKKHQDWNDKYCPHRILDENRWNEFVENVKKARKNQE